MKSYSDSYKAAGVDVTAGYKSVELMKEHVKRTSIPGVVSGIGGFGGLFQPDMTGMKEPVLVSGTDGVGTKLVAAMLLVLLYLRPTPAVRIAMKLFMAFLNFWIAGVYYMIYCRPREYHGMLALFWAIMGGIWIYELLVKHASLERTGQHNAFAVLLLVMPLIYPLCSLALGHEFPIMTSPVMPCSVAVFTIGLMLAFSERVNIVLAMFLCHWALIGLSKVYFFGIPEDYLLACSTIPALYIFFREYVRSNADRPMKPSAHVLDALLITLCLVIGIFFTFTLLHQLDLFTRII